jgi:hypothetical protein
MADDATPQTATPPAQQTPAPAQPQTQSPDVTATIPEQQPEKAPTVLVPQKRSGLGGIVDEFRDAVAGKTASETYIDPNTGEKYIQHPNLTGKQQWARIGADALRGAAAGLANGQGPGGPERAAAAGIQTGMDSKQKQFDQQDEAAQQDYTRQRQAKLDRANDQINTAKLVSAQLANTRMEVNGTHDDIDWSEKRQQQLHDGGARLVGYAKDVGDLSRIQREDETDLLKNHFHANSYVTVPMYGDDGKSNGIAIYAKAPGWGDQLVASGTTIPIWVPPAKPGELPTRKDVTPTVPMTNDQVQSYQNLYDKQQTEFAKQQAELKQKGAQADQEATAATKNKAQTSEANANTRKADAETKKTNAETANLGNGGAPGAGGGDANKFATEPTVNGVRPNYLNTIPADDRSIVRNLGEGLGDAKTVLRYSLAREGSPGYRIFHELTTAYPGFDVTRAPTYEATRKEFTSGKQADAINALNTAMAHMQTMYDNSDWLTTTPILGAAERVMGNQRATDLKDSKTALVDELGKAYKGGALTIEDKKSWSDRINAWSPAETKANARSFIKLLHGKLEAYENQWRNGSPPGAVSPIAFMGPAAQSAYKDIMGNAPPPQGATGKVKGSDGNWYWTDGKNNMGRVE